MKQGYHHHEGEIRIIGGRWRSRRLRFPEIPQLRPSPDAVRERLFNWLQVEIPGARCLDLFAGSGALGLEAASRGASRVTLVESNQTAVRSLVRNIELLGASHNIDVVHNTVEHFLQTTTLSFDLVFMDPPFSSDLIQTTCRLLSQGELIKGKSLLYIESSATQEQFPVLPDWPIIRQKDQGSVRSTLFHLEPSVYEL